MFESIRKCLDELEESLDLASRNDNLFSRKNKDAIEYFELHLAKALMEECDSEKVAKIILAAKGLSNEVVVKVE